MTHIIRRNETLTELREQTRARFRAEITRFREEANISELRREWFEIEDLIVGVARSNAPRNAKAAREIVRSHADEFAWMSTCEMQTTLRPGNEFNHAVMTLLRRDLEDEFEALRVGESVMGSEGSKS